MSGLADENATIDEHLERERQKGQEAHQDMGQREPVECAWGAAPQIVDHAI